MRLDDPNVTEEEVQDRINEVDYDGNGNIEFEEFVLIQSKRIMDNKEQRIREMFKMFDEDGNNSLSVMELQKGIAEMGDEFSIEELEELLQKANIDPDSEIHVEEFIKFWKMLSWLSAFIDFPVSKKRRYIFI